MLERNHSFGTLPGASLSHTCVRAKKPELSHAPGLLSTLKVGCKGWGVVGEGGWRENVASSDMRKGGQGPCARESHGLREKPALMLSRRQEEVEGMQ